MTDDVSCIRKAKANKAKIEPHKGEAKRHVMASLLYTPLPKCSPSVRVYVHVLLATRVSPIPSSVVVVDRLIEDKISNITVLLSLTSRRVVIHRSVGYRGGDI